jgi:hypothetical protein
MPIVNAESLDFTEPDASYCGRGADVFVLEYHIPDVRIFGCGAALR